MFMGEGEQIEFLICKTMHYAMFALYGEQIGCSFPDMTDQNIYVQELKNCYRKRYLEGGSEHTKQKEENVILQKLIQSCFKRDISIDSLKQKKRNAIKKCSVQTFAKVFFGADFFMENV